ncbi:AAA family ATPase [Photobacterium piscicola]|uniref:DUF3696 domain-containing protein n=1 Tax=Photobacterium piscicola TaxID=1378299 RepID=A0ABU6LFN5_9GAMM|nr:DUF3696 domain-containing protein [Photobacterium piscicola]
MKLKSISLKNFKSFEKLSIDLKNLNILTGANSVGKSTVIQSLLLIKQNKDYISREITIPEAHEHDEIGFFERFNLNGDYVNSGHAGSLLYIDADDDELEISVSVHESTLNITKHTDKTWKVKCNLHDSDDKTPDYIKKLISLRDYFDFSYLSTNRVSPQIIYPLSEYDVSVNSLGIYGQFTAHYLAEKKAKPLNIKALKHKNSKTEFLLENVSHWLAEISENIDVTAKVIPEANQAAITYSYSYGNNKSRELTPLNVGFGVTHALPVVTLLLMSSEGDVVVIENPEAHLHPKGQANLAKLISLVAAQGVQIILETHSDHILNGIRVATKDGIISPEQSKIYFFQRKEDSLSSIVTNITIQEDGSVSQWPKGFFDEWDTQLDKLLW